MVMMVIIMMVHTGDTGCSCYDCYVYHTRRT